MRLVRLSKTNTAITIEVEDSRNQKCSRLQSYSGSKAKLEIKLSTGNSVQYCE